MADPPLTGLTVLALEHAIAAPLCSRQLAELGARVIKVERRGTGDFARHYDNRARGLSSHFVWTNRGKESLTLDIKRPEAAGILQRLLARSDVLLQNLGPSACARLGLDYAELAPRYPRLIVCNISGYGSGGPYHDRKAYDLLVQAEAGLLSITGTEAQMAKSGISIADIAAGTQAHGAILAALLQSQRTGTGCEINISMLEALTEWMGFPLYFSLDGQDPPSRSGADHASIYPYGVFANGDGGLIMLGLQNEREWCSLCLEVLSQPELSNDPRFSDNSRRSSNRVALKAILDRAFASMDTQTLTKRLDTARIAWAHINDMEAVWKHPQLNASNSFTQADTPNGPIPALRPPARNSDFETAAGAVPSLGENTRSILQELGFAKPEIDAFYRSEVV